MCVRYRLFLLSLAAACLFQTACNTGRRLTESGAYDAAVNLYVQKLKGKSRKKTAHVQGLETAFARANQRDIQMAKSLVNEEDPDNWERINELYRQIGRRQNLVRPLLPLRSKDGYTARIELRDVSQLERESRENAAENLYAKALQLLDRADRGDKQAARDALTHLETIERKYFRAYKDKDQLKLRARDLGSSYIIFEVRNQSGMILPRHLLDRLTLNKTELDSEWKAFYMQESPGWTYDYRAVFRVRQADISPERVSERRYVDEREIEDGWDYVLDDRGNVKKDSMGNDIKTPRKVRISAEVMEVIQTKAARFSGVLEIYDRRNQLLESRDLQNEVLFENFAATFRGDERALSKESRRKIGNRPVPFPSQDDMMIQAIERLKPRLRDELRRSRAIF